MNEWIIKLLTVGMLVGMVSPIQAFQGEDLILDGEIRIRPEYQGNYTDFSNSAADNGDFVSSRVRLGARLPLDKDVATNSVATTG